MGFMKTLHGCSVVLVLGIIAQSQTPEFGAAVSNEVPVPQGKPGITTMRLDNTDAEPAKGAPFCAVITTEHTQMFADGNRIHTTDSSTLCRDRQGRIRREGNVNLLGAVPQGFAPKLITIIDPVAGSRYMLDSDNKIAHRFSISPYPAPAPSGLPDRGHFVMYQRIGTGTPELSMGSDVMFKAAGKSPEEPAPITEDLGDQQIDGIHMRGRRLTTIIPAGTMGNEQPITVSSEQWYSPELKATVMTKHTDPWAGELKTQFKDVNTAIPDPSLFAVPTDYKVVDEKNGPFVIQKRSLSVSPSRP